MITVVVTGASSGLGARAAHRFSAAGARVIVVGRDHDRAERVAREVGAEFLTADFTRLSTVYALAKSIRDSTDRVDVLASNAGGVPRAGLTVDGIEATLQTNAVAPWLLMVELSQVLTGGRIVATSSRSHTGAALDVRRLDEMLVTTDGLSAHRAYGRAKLAGGILLREFLRRHPQIDGGDFHPGIMATDFGRHMGWRGNVLKHLTAPFIDGPDDGAARLVRLAYSAAPLGRRYFVKDRPGTGSPQLHDPDLGSTLWRLVEKVTIDTL